MSGKLRDPRLTSSGRGYIEPFIDEMDAMAKHYGFKAYPVVLIKDMANIASGGKIIKNTTLGITTQQHSRLVSDLSNIDMGKNHSDILTAEESYCQNIQALASLPWNTIPGQTPLAKAFVVLSLLCKSGFDPTQGNCPGGIRMMGDRIKQYNDMQSTDQKMQDALQSGKEAGHENDPNKTFIEAIDFLTKNHHWVWERVSRQLELAKTFNARRSISFKADSSGDEVKYRGIEDINEIQAIAPFEWTPGMFDDDLLLLKLVQGDCDIRERGHRLQNKQLMYIVVDASGSMMSNMDSRDNPMTCPARKASGIIYNRLKSVVEGDAALFVRFFSVGFVGDLHKIFDEADALKYLKRFSDGKGNLGSYNGGGTDIPRALKDGLTEIKQLMDGYKEKGFVRPELVLVTDGECDCRSVSRLDFLRAKARLHYIELTSSDRGGRRFSNMPLARLASATGGIYAKF